MATNTSSRPTTPQPPPAGQKRLGLSGVPEYDAIIDPATGETVGYIRIRLDQTTQIQLTGSNWPEHLHTIDDHLPRERLHHFGFEKNQLSMLAWQTYRNAQTQAVFAPSHADPAPPLERTG
ncbi:MAG TPA: hypothetical protein VLB67_07765 [Acidimicrobiia bacterium]|nr:hypothetical protein [Acidimicrobiia bacterium]